MKVLFFTRRFYPHVGGVEKHVLRVSQKLIKKGYGVTVLTEKHKKSLKSKEDYKEIQIVRLPNFAEGKFKKFRIWKWLWSNRDLFKNADTIHAHDVAYWWFPFKFIYPHKSFFTTFHGYETVFPPASSAVRQRRLAARISRGTINVGDYIKKWYGTSSDYVVYGGVDPVKKLKSDVKNKSSKFKILFIGRLEKDIGVDIYLEALENLKKQGVSYELIMCGDGSYRAKFAKLGEVHGFVSNLASNIGKSDVVLASSYLSILEVLSYNKSVAAVYTNPLKKDYLTLSPFANNIMICRSADDVETAILNYKKSRRPVYVPPSWNDVTEVYIKVWKKI